MQYSQIDSTFKYDQLAEAIYNREVEYFQYELEKNNLTQILTTELTDADRASITERRELNQVQMDIVEKIHTGLVSQIADQAAYDAAVARAVAKRAAA